MRYLAAPWRAALTPGVMAAATIVALGIGQTASATPRLLVVGAIGLVAAAVTFFSLRIGLAVFTLVSFFELFPTAYGGNLSVVKLVGAVLTLGWVAALLDGRSHVRVLLLQRPAFAASAVFVAAWGFISVAWARDSGQTLYSASRLLQVVVLSFIVYSAVQTVRTLRLIVWIFLTGSSLTAGYGLANGLTAGRSGRLVGGLADPNFLAAVLVAAIVLGTVLFVAAGSVGRLILVGYLAVCLPALFLTGSRGGLLAFASALVIAPALAGPARAQLTGLVLLLVSVGVAYYALVAPATARHRVTELSAQSSAGRVDQYQIALQIAGQHPLAGVGLGNYTVVQPSYISATKSFYDVRSLVVDSPVHNTYLSTLAELGVVGLVSLLLTFVGSLYLGVKGFRERARAGDREGELLGRGLVVATIALGVAYAFLPGLYDKQLWLMLGLTAAVAGLRDDHAQRAT